MSDARNSSNNTRHASRSTGATHMSNKQKGAAGAKKSGESEAEIADAFMEEIAKRERLSAAVELKKLQGSGDTGTGKKKKGKKSSTSKKIVLKPSTDVKPDGTAPSATVPSNKCSVCEKPATSKCKCLVVHYCSRECQVLDWKVHKKVCLANPKNLLKINGMGGGEKKFDKVEEKVEGVTDDIKKASIS